jgi:hypothetical protein
VVANPLPAGVHELFQNAVVNVKHYCGFREEKWPNSPLLHDAKPNDRFKAISDHLSVGVMIFRPRYASVLPSDFSWLAELCLVRKEGTWKEVGTDIVRKQTQLLLVHSGCDGARY